MKQIVAGGTFDLLHKGHKSFLTQILNQADHLLLGLTSDKYVLENKEEVFENFEIRKKNLEEFLFDYKNRVEIVPIDNIYGPLLNSDIKPNAIVVTEQTKGSVEKINEKRKELGLSKIESIVLPMSLAEDGSEISSTRIRNGEINREGKLYFNPSWQGKFFVMPENLRDELSKPFGQVLNDIPIAINGKKTITVGDITSKLFNDKNIRQRLSIVDLHVRRERKFNSTYDLGFEKDINVYEIKNPKGTISYDLLESIKKSLKDKIRNVILINGEDDLAVLPCLILFPLGYTIFYGQPDEGLVQIIVTEENKEKAYKLISSFEIS